MTTTDTTRGLTPVITYQNLAGALVIVHDTATPPADPDLSSYHFNATCDGCLNECRTMQPNVHLIAAREWAAKHAGECRALPRTMPTDDADREKYRAFAAEYANRVIRLLEGKSATPDRISKIPIEARTPLEAAQIYASVADVYVRLARD